MKKAHLLKEALRHSLPVMQLMPRYPQALIANVPGVRREGVTAAALSLQKQGPITYLRGPIAVLDRPGLGRRTCECCAVVRKAYDRLLPELAAT